MYYEMQAANYDWLPADLICQKNQNITYSPLRTLLNGVLSQIYVLHKTILPTWKFINPDLQKHRIHV